ncbi:MAG TPA: PspC domain-containing protein [Bacteroidia bacterium]|nr:PspC domain-containing protein [Bacteroidia bacterium]
MNKTVTINISGIIFHIEEEAYEKLSKYLTTIRGYFNKSEGGSEIMSDIEARIAEMLQGKTSAIKQVVLMSDVDFVMDSMGKPEEFAGESNENSSTAENTETSYQDTEPVKKRLYRDGDSKVIGGVCSGIGNYFDIDAVWLRIALLLMFFFAGTGFLLYLILWIAIPEAKTTAEKLAMKGERADINNISKAVKEEAEHLKKRMEKYGDDFKNMAADSRLAPRNTIEKIVDFLGDVLTNIGKVLLKVIGVFMVIIGIIFFLGLSSSIFGLSFMTDSSNGGDWIDLMLLDGKDFYLGVLGIVMFVGVPVVMIIYGGIKILFKIRFSNRWVNLTAGIIWLFGLLMLLYVGVKTGSDFNKTAKVRENFSVVQKDVLFLKMHETPIKSSELHESDDDEEGEKNYRRHSRGDNDYMIGSNNGIKYLLGHAQLNVIKSQSGKIEIVIVKEAKGANKFSATERAKNISYVVSQTDSLIEFDNLFKVNNADKFRVQDLSIIVKLPVGKTIYLDKSLENMIYDIENVTNTYDGDMVNRRWTMTENGLKCVDCDGLISVGDHINGLDEEVDIEKDIKIDVNGVNINAKDAKIKVDSNGVKIHSKESKVTIDKNGVHIDSKKQ